MGLDLDRAAPKGDGAPDDERSLRLAQTLLAAFKARKAEDGLVLEGYGEASEGCPDVTVLIDGRFNLLAIASDLLLHGIDLAPSHNS